MSSKTMHEAGNRVVARQRRAGAHQVRSARRASRSSCSRHSSRPAPKRTRAPATNWPSRSLPAASSGSERPPPSDMAFGMGVCPVKELEDCGRRDRAWGRRLGLEQFVQHDGGRSPFPHAPAVELRALGGDALRCAPLGDRRLGALPRPRRHRRDRARHAGRPRALYARRAALLGRPGRDRRACAVRGASRRPGDGRGDMAGDRRGAPRASTSPP